MNQLLQPSEYLKELKKRAKTSRVYYKYQFQGLEIAEILQDKKHKSLYIKLAKEIDGEKLLQIAKTIAENKRIKNKGAYFMWKLKNEGLLKKLTPKQKEKKRKKSKRKQK